MTLATRLKEFRQGWVEPLWPNLGNGESSTPTRIEDESDGITRSVHRSSRSINTYWLHYRDNPVIRAAVNEIVNALVSIPLIAEEYSPADKAWIPLEPDDEYMQFLAAPSQTVSPPQWYQHYYANLIVSGGGYWWKQRDTLDGLREGVIVDSRAILPIASASGGIDRFQFYPNMFESVNSVLGLQGIGTPYPVKDIVYTSLTPDPVYPLLGLSPIASVLKEIDIDDAITRFTTRLMERGAIHEWAMISKTPVTDAQVNRIERRWFRKRAGVDNAGGLVVVDGTEVDLKQLGMSIGPRDMGMMDLRKQVEARMLMALNVPPIVVGAVIGIENATYSNYGQARMAMHEENTDPLLARICGAWEWSLRDEFPSHRGKIVRIRADLSHVWAMLESLDKRDRLALAKFEGGAMSHAETRAAMDAPPLRGVAPYYLTPSGYNVQQIGTAGAPIAPVIPGAGGTQQKSPDMPAAPTQGEMRRLRKGLADNNKPDAMRTLSTRIQTHGYNETDADFLAFDVLFRLRGDAGETLTAKSWRMLATADEMALQQARKVG